MSTSPSRALAPPIPAPQMETEPFPYDTVVETSRARIGLASPGLAGLGSALEDSSNSVAGEVQGGEANARARGRQEGLAEARRHYEDRISQERAGLAAALSQFTRDRAAYFQKVETEVVGLALAIARKILYREAQVDPLLLAGVVRVALEKIDGATGVTLHLHPQNAADWQKYLSTCLDPADLPQIVEDSSQPPDQCVLETSMGTAAIGLDVQLKEIEQGFMDLLAARPGSKA